MYFCRHVDIHDMGHKFYLSKYLLPLTLLLFLLLRAENAEAKGGRGGGGRGGGSRGGSRGGGSRGSGGRGKGGFRGGKATVRRVGIGLIVGLALRRSYSRARSIPKSNFIHYNSNELDSNFVVNQNRYNTSFILIDDNNYPYSCLILPSYLKASDCPTAFTSIVTSETRFLLPSEFNNTNAPAIRPASQIDICCGSSKLYPCILLLVLVSFSSFYHNLKQ
ncbi:uncharacterized protein LOC143448383 [Clavelina lepadiformis]|uniref:uncharacterized protein LOC143448383 n=1 Tax=Clavelina lepadiformis TaxID=159417 RepID=UPI00404155CF